MKMCEQELGRGVGRPGGQIMALPEFPIFSKMCVSSELPRSSPTPKPPGQFENY